MDAKKIKFGTDGWRGIIADDFTFDRVALVGSAIRAYLEETGQGEKPLLVSYDRRFAAEAYAAHLATHLVSLGQSVIVAEEPCPTPVVAFGVKHLKAAGAIQLTASHNPHYYQGLKFIPHFAGPAMPEATDRITGLIQELARDFDPPRLVMEWEGERTGFKDAYFKHLDSIVNQHSLSSCGWRVLYNPMHGVGTGYLDDYLRANNVEVVTINASRNVYFGDGLPDPSPNRLVPLVDKLVENDCNVLIGTDGDADRFGIVDKEGRYYGANEALPMLADYLIRYKQLKGNIIRTVATSHLVDEVAKEHGLALEETKVGFKYVGDKLREGALIGGEESGGLSVQGHIPEKDGILTSVLMVELASTSGDDLHNLLAALHERLGPRAFIRVDQHLDDAAKKKLFGALEVYDKKQFAGRNISQRITKDGQKFVFEDGSWVLMRPSGTEPVVRTYMEVTQPDALPKFKAQVLDAIKAMIS